MIKRFSVLLLQNIINMSTKIQKVYIKLTLDSYKVNVCA